MVRVTLTRDEEWVARLVGLRRWQIARKNGQSIVTKLRGTPTGVSEETDVQSVGSEIAVAKAINKYWHPDLHPQSKHEPDVGHATQVRWTGRERGKLIVTPNDQDNHMFYLVRGHLPNYDVVGRLPAKSAKQEKWLRNPGNRGPAYFVPEEALIEVRQV